MAYRDRKRDKRRPRENGLFAQGGDAESSYISREKQKARDLRQSAWWKKKTAPGICHYCGRRFAPADLTMDHKIPLARGGTSEKINLVPACKECNNKKKHLLPLEWEEYMDTIKNS